MLSKHIRGFLICCWILIFGVCCLLFFMAFRSASIESQSPIFVCGNAAMESTAMNDSTYPRGKAVFYSNCAACHHPVKDATGPALRDMSLLRSPEWMCKFLTNPKFIPKDKRATGLRKQYYGVKCMKFPKLNCEDIKAVVKYTDHYGR